MKYLIQLSYAHIKCTVCGTFVFNDKKILLYFSVRGINIFRKLDAAVLDDCYGVNKICLPVLIFYFLAFIPFFGRMGLACFFRALLSPCFPDHCLGILISII